MYFMTVIVVFHKIRYLSLDLTVHVSGLNWFQCSWLQSKVKTHLFSIEPHWCCIMLLKLCPQNGWREIAGYSRNLPVMCFPLCSTCGTVMWKTSLHRFVLYSLEANFVPWFLCVGCLWLSYNMQESTLFQYFEFPCCMDTHFMHFCF
jgi:hypothetical protein